MNDLKPIDLRNPRIKPRSSPGAAKRRIAIGFLVTLIVLVMVGWLGFLGWGFIELLWAIGPYLTKLWSML
jgi:hypothetical protein